MNHSVQKTHTKAAEKTKTPNPSTAMLVDTADSPGTRTPEAQLPKLQTPKPRPQEQTQVQTLLHTCFGDDVDSSKLHTATLAMTGLLELFSGRNTQILEEKANQIEQNVINNVKQEMEIKYTKMEELASSERKEILERLDALESRDTLSSCASVSVASATSTASSLRSKLGKPPLLPKIVNEPKSHILFATTNVAITRKELQPQIAQLMSALRINASTWTMLGQQTAAEKKHTILFRRDSDRSQWKVMDNSYATFEQFVIGVHQHLNKDLTAPEDQQPAWRRHVATKRLFQGEISLSFNRDEGTIARIKSTLLKEAMDFILREATINKDELVKTKSGAIQWKEKDLLRIFVSANGHFRHTTSEPELGELKIDAEKLAAALQSRYEMWCL